MTKYDGLFEMIFRTLDTQQRLQYLHSGLYQVLECSWVAGTGLVLGPAGNQCWEACPHLPLLQDQHPQCW